MNLSAILIIFGAMLLLIPQTMWVGVALLAIGAVTYSIAQTSPMSIPQAWYAPYPRRLEQAGISMTRRHPLEQGKQGPRCSDAKTWSILYKPAELAKNKIRISLSSYEAPSYCMVDAVVVEAITSDQ